MQHELKQVEVRLKLDRIKQEIFSMELHRYTGKSGFCSGTSISRT